MVKLFKKLGKLVKMAERPRLEFSVESEMDFHPAIPICDALKEAVKKVDRICVNTHYRDGKGENYIVKKGDIPSSLMYHFRCAARGDRICFEFPRKYSDYAAQLSEQIEKASNGHLRYLSGAN